MTLGLSGIKITAAVLNREVPSWRYGDKSNMIWKGTSFFIQDFPNSLTKKYSILRYISLTVKFAGSDVLRVHQAREERLMRLGKMDKIKT